MNYGRYYSTKATQQSSPIPGTNQVQNAAGGYAFPLDDWKRLQRFLILCSEGGTYYIGEREFTVDNANAVLRCIKADGEKVVNLIREISTSKRAPKNEPALFALAMASHFGDTRTRQLAFCALDEVARTSTHLFAFCEYRQAFAGWGRGMRTAVADWYNGMPAEKLAYQLVKYRQRNGWTHRDVLRLAHPIPDDEAHDILYEYATRGTLPEEDPGDWARVLGGYELSKTTTNVDDWVHFIRWCGLTWEMLPTEALAHKEVWTALLPNMPATALVRNLGRMTANGTLTPLSDNVRLVCDKIETLNSNKVHPWAILNALTTYVSGHSQRGDTSWKPISQIADALDAAFYKGFGYVESTGKRIALCVDVSGSMSSNVITSGFDAKGEKIPGMEAAQAAAAMALIIANTEPNNLFLTFNTTATPLPISPRMRLGGVTKEIKMRISGGTNCASPIEYCSNEKIPVDAFIILTDEETWYGNLHPTQAIQEYRRMSGINAKLVVVSMCANGYSIADPEDAGHINVVGFDTATPQLISDFIKE